MRPCLAAAVKSAKKSDVKRGKIGAVLFAGNNRILVSAHNAVLWGNKDRTIHAEARLIYKALKMKIFDRYREEHLSVLVVRWRKQDDKLANAMPCDACYSLLKRFRLDIFFTNENGNILWMP